MTAAVVLFSGGMDSTIALYHARQHMHPISALFIDYGQRNARWEYIAAKRIFDMANVGNQANFVTKVVAQLWETNSSVLKGGVPVREYAGVDDAVEGTMSDPGYLPARNIVLIGIAAHVLLSYYPTGGMIVTGDRQRLGGGGFPDCTQQFQDKMGSAITEGVGTSVVVHAPLNNIRTTRADSIEYAKTLSGCIEALKFSRTCWQQDKDPCNKCLPCIRRNEAIKKVGLEDLWHTA